MQSGGPGRARAPGSVRWLRAQVYVEQSLQPRFPDVNVVDLQEAWRDIVKRARLVRHHVISREELSVREQLLIQ